MLSANRLEHGDAEMVRRVAVIPKSVPTMDDEEERT